jgi:hypothetical protein
MNFLGWLRWSVALPVRVAGRRFSGATSLYLRADV